ncbi:MAG: crossover junction endodeoxyribonuclease RuvC [Patescibacteria group bacterium]
MKVLGIDPGFARLGVAVVEEKILLYSDCLETSSKADHAERLRELGEGVRKIVLKWQPEVLAIEKLFFNQNTTNALKVAEARGVVLYEAARAGLSVFEYSPQEVKLAVTGYGKADKSSINVMVGKLVALPSKEMLDDELDAIALGITHLASRRTI